MLCGDVRPHVRLLACLWSGGLCRSSGPNDAGGTACVKIGTGGNVMSTIAGVKDLTGEGVADVLAAGASPGDPFRSSGPSHGGGSAVEIGTNW